MLLTEEFLMPKRRRPTSTTLTLNPFQLAHLSGAIRIPLPNLQLTHGPRIIQLPTGELTMIWMPLRSILLLLKLN